MNVYAMVGSGIGSAKAAALRERLAAWHDAMVAHERQIRGGRTDERCDEECPHAEARVLWSEAVDTFGERARDLTFLSTRAQAGPSPSSRRVVPTDVSESADREPDTTGSGGTPTPRRSTRCLRSSGPPRASALEV